MANPSDPFESKTTAAKTSKPRLFSGKNAKAARKVMDAESASDTSDNHTTISLSVSGRDDQSDSDARPRRPNQGGIIRYPRPSNLGKSARKVTFDVDDDAGSDDGTLHADPSPRRAPQRLPPVRPEFPLPMENVVRMKKGVRRRAKGLQHNDADANHRPSKVTRHYHSERVERTVWKGSGLSRKEYNGGQKQYSRMSIGSASRQRSSQGSETSMDEDVPMYYFQHMVIPADGDTGASEDLYEPPQPLIAKAARKHMQVGKKSAPQLQSSLKQPPDIGESSFLSLPSPSSPSSSSSSSEDENPVQFTRPPESLLGVLESISSTAVQLLRVKQLPFLCRNLATGFLLACHSLGIDIEDSPCPQSISVVYSYKPPTTTLGNTHDHPTITVKSTMKSWMCPFCNLHRKFPNPAVLNKHLSWDHPSVQVLWSQDYEMVFLNIHDSQSELPVMAIPQLSAREVSVINSTSNTPCLDNTQGASGDQKAPNILSSTPSLESTGSKSSTPFNSQDELKYATGKYSIEAAGSRSTSTSGGAVSQGQSRADAQAGLAPMATFPYLPESNESGIVYYSCRPGGPRLFDILNTQSLQSFGVLKWIIVDREEELFELDDILDEDKVMQALWFRWIFFNRNKFVANYFDGAKAFIRENWQLIKQGAGLLALRTWLLVLAINNFLLVTEVATLMRFYQELADIVPQ